MATSRKSERLRYRYGICLNDNCEKCKSKEIQEIPTRKDFVCQNQDCGKPLRECPPPKKKSSKKLIIGIIAAAIILGCISIMFLSGGEEAEVNMPAEPTPTSVRSDTVIKSDTVIVRDTIIKDNATTISEKTRTTTIVNTTKTDKSASSSLSLSYGKYTGAVKNGYPHGQGKLTYSTTRQINKNDVKGRTANAGDYVIGEFFNGFVVYGKHYDSDGNLLESLNFGVGAEDNYDSK